MKRNEFHLVVRINKICKKCGKIKLMFRTQKTCDECRGVKRDEEGHIK